MKSLLILTLSLCGLSGVFAEKPRIAVVDISTVFSKYYRKIEAEKAMQDRLAEIKVNPRAVAVQELDAKLSELAEMVRDEKNTKEERETAMEEFNSTTIEYRSLAKELENFMSIEQQKVTVSLVDNIEKITTEVRDQVQVIGKEMGYDLVLEVGGVTSTQISPIIYIRDGIDISDEVVTRLNADAPAAEEAPQPEGSPAE